MTDIFLAPQQVRQLERVKESEAFGHVIDPSAKPANELHWAHKARLIRIILIDKKTAKLALTDAGRAVLQAHTAPVEA
jgi:hypothetical protein